MIAPKVNENAVRKIATGVARHSSPPPSDPAAYPYPTSPIPAQTTNATKVRCGQRTIHAASAKFASSS
jgi:hypothetical protein